MPTDDTKRPAVVLVLGKAGVGKSTFIKAATGLDIAVGNHLETCTHEVQIYPVPDTNIFLIDTPGFDDPQRSDSDILQSIASCLADLHEGLIFDGQEINLASVIYVHTIQDVRMTGTMMQNLEVFRNLVGHEHMRHCVLLSTKWGLESASTAEARESELLRSASFWKDDIKAGAQPLRFENSRLSAQKVLAAAMRQGDFTPQLTTEYVADGRALVDTTAGRAINKDLAQIRANHSIELLNIQKELSKSSSAHNAEVAAQMQALRSRSEGALRNLDKDMRMLSQTRDEELDDVDSLEYQSVERLLSKENADLPSQHLTRRQKRALRWFVRFAGLGAAVTMTALTHGAMAPVGLGLVVGIESMLQAVKANETHEQQLAQQQGKKRD